MNLGKKRIWGSVLKGFGGIVAVAGIYTIVAGYGAHGWWAIVVGGIVIMIVFGLVLWGDRLDR